MKEPIWTHNGWMLLCPIKIAELDSEAPVVAARCGLLEPWLSVQHGCQAFMIWALSLLDPDYEPAFMFRITSERKAQ